LQTWCAVANDLPAGVVSQPDMMLAWRWIGRCRCGGCWVVEEELKRRGKQENR
jgi:hypothetical protein